LAAERLARSRDVALIIAGRDLAKARAAAARLAAASGAEISAAQIDAARPDGDQIRALAPAVVYNAVGPFQSLDYALARAAIAVRAHYVDLADARAFVAGIGALEAPARDAGVLVVAGASSVPGLSSAVIAHVRPQFRTLSSLRYGIAPGNAFDPGLGTTASILGALGQPFLTRERGREVVVHGWQGLVRHRFEGIGTRWLARVDIPDLAVLPTAYPELRTIDFRAGLELPLMHFGLWALSWPARLGWLRRPERLAAPLLRAKGWLRRWGTDTGGFFAELSGTGLDGAPLTVCWQLEARADHGPYIPQAAATALTRALLSGREQRRGALPCVGLVPLPALLDELADLDITVTQV
jgi:hypothetical protein